MILTFIMLVLSASTIIPAQRSSPSITYHDPLQDTVRCNLATVYRLGPSGRLAVHRAASGRATVTARLAEGQIVYVCDQDRSWLHVYFSGTEAPCFRSYDGGLVAWKARTCSSGWVRDHWVNVISG